VLAVKPGVVVVRNLYDHKFIVDKSKFVCYTLYYKVT
jgi:hypothetical protein